MRRPPSREEPLHDRRVEVREAGGVRLLPARDERLRETCAERGCDNPAAERSIDGDLREPFQEVGVCRGRRESPLALEGREVPLRRDDGVVARVDRGARADRVDEDPLILSFDLREDVGRGVGLDDLVLVADRPLEQADDGPADLEERASPSNGVRLPDLVCDVPRDRAGESRVEDRTVGETYEYPRVPARIARLDDPCDRAAEEVRVRQGNGEPGVQRSRRARVVFEPQAVEETPGLRR